MDSVVHLTVLKLFPIAAGTGSRRCRIGVIGRKRFSVDSNQPCRFACDYESRLTWICFYVRGRRIILRDTFFEMDNAECAFREHVTISNGITNFSITQFKPELLYRVSYSSQRFGTVRFNSRTLGISSSLTCGRSN